MEEKRMYDSGGQSTKTTDRTTKWVQQRVLGEANPQLNKFSLTKTHRVTTPPSQSSC